MDGGIVREIVLWALPILIAITFHEAAHGFAAYKLGDKTAWAVGRMTLNPIKHIDPLGTVLVPVILLIMGFTPIGWAKPVPINPYNFRDPKRDMALSAAAGPAMNIVLAIICIVISNFILYPLSGIFPSLRQPVLQPLNIILASGVAINVFLACFNLIPIPPLDGGRIAVGLLPRNQSLALSRIEPYGLIIVILLVFVLKIYIIFIPIMKIFLSFIKLI